MMLIHFDQFPVYLQFHALSFILKIYLDFLISRYAFQPFSFPTSGIDAEEQKTESTQVINSKDLGNPLTA